MQLITWKSKCKSTHPQEISEVIQSVLLVKRESSVQLIHPKVLGTVMILEVCKKEHATEKLIMHTIQVGKKCKNMKGKARKP